MGLLKHLAPYIPVPQITGKGSKVGISFTRLSNLERKVDTKKKDVAPDKKDTAADTSKTGGSKEQFVSVGRNCTESPPDFFVYARVVTRVPPVLSAYFITGARKGTTAEYTEKEFRNFTDAAIPAAWMEDPTVQADPGYVRFKEHPRSVRAGYSGLLEMVEKAAKVEKA